jgi:hypothetical protein
MFDHLHFGFMIPAMVKTVFLWFLIGAAQVGAQSVIQRPGCSGTIHGVVYSLSKRPAAGVQVLAFPMGIQLGAQLPTARADQNGEYRFEHVCHGTYSVIPDDPEAGYPRIFPEENEFLYGTAARTVRLTSLRDRAELRVYLGPKPAIVLLHVLDSKTHSEISDFTLKLKVPGQGPNAELRIGFYANVDRHVNVPSGREVVFKVKAAGYQELSQSISTHSDAETTLKLVLFR